MQRKVLITGLVAVGLSLAACGDDGNSDGKGGTDSAGSIGVMTIGDGDGDGDVGDGDGDGDVGDGDGDGDVGDGDGDGDVGDGDGDGDGASGGGIKFDVNDGIVGGMGGDCEAVNITGEPEPPDIMFILDRSCSMGGQRWTDLNTAVQFIVNNYQAQVNFGSRAYPPYVGGDSCTNFGVDIAMGPGTTTGPAIVSQLQGAGPTGATPTPPAVDGAIQHLQGLATDGDKVAILIADGNVNSCGTATDVTTTIGNAYNGGNAPSISTYVVAVGGVTSANFNTWASAGGTGTSYNTSNLAGLQTALDSIIAGVISCTVKLDPPPDFPDLVEVTVGGVTYSPPLSDASACGDGFYYTSAAQDEIELCGAACNDLKTELSADITYKCSAG